MSEFHLDRKIRQVPNGSDGLYKLALEEIDDHGKPLSREFTGWALSIYFSATDITVSSEFTINEPFDDGVFRSSEREVRLERRIWARLKPDSRRGGVRDWHIPTFKMFGADRPIEDFTLIIRPLGDDKELEVCRAWGCVSYTAEIDIMPETTDDCVQFYLFVKPSTFEHYIQRIDAGANDMQLRVGKVSGFYANSSPMITTPLIKVLTRGEEHVVQPAEGGEAVEIHRLGNVGEVSLTIMTQRKFNGPEVQTHEEPKARTSWWKR